MKYHRGIMKYVISVSKTYIHRGKHLHKRAKKHWHVYYYDENWKLHCEPVNWLQAMYYKTKKLRRIKYYCLECGSKFVGLVKKETDSIECPYC